MSPIMFQVSVTSYALAVIALMCLASTVAQQRSICQTMQYRALSLALQNEHQCMILEKLQGDFDTEKNNLKSQYDTIYSMLSTFQENLLKNIRSISAPSRDSGKAIPTLRDIPLVRDCNELLQNGVSRTGVYPIRLPDRTIVNVFCDMDTSYGGWTTVQRRMDGSTDFTRNWDDYAFGFGNVNGEFWLGNENLYHLTHHKEYSVRFDLWDWEGNRAYALYDTFRVDSEQMMYQLKIGGYSGTAGDAMSRYHNNMKFSTIDSDNDEWYLSCAKKDKSGWWFRACGFASPNGMYVPNGRAEMTPDGIIRGISWYNWKNDFGYSMKRVEMKIKPHVSVKYDKELDKLKEEEESKAAGEKDTTDSTVLVTQTTTNIPHVDHTDPVETSDNEDEPLKVDTTESPTTTTEFITTTDYEYEYGY